MRVVNLVRGLVVNDLNGEVRFIRQTRARCPGKGTTIGDARSDDDTLSGCRHWSPLQPQRDSTLSGRVPVQGNRLANGRLQTATGGQEGVGVAGTGTTLALSNGYGHQGSENEVVEETHGASYQVR